MNTVHYSDLGFCVVGCPADVMPLDHPNVPRGQWARTTPIVTMEWTAQGPLFTTRNNLYVPCDPDEAVAKTREMETT